MINNLTPAPLFAALAFLVISCDRPAAERSDAQPQATPLVVSAAQFGQLRWLEGTWRGRGGGIDAFFEGYRWVDDSTIRKVDFADSTLAVVRDSSDITLRGNRVRSGTESISWVVV